MRIHKAVDDVEWLLFGGNVTEGAVAGFAVHRIAGEVDGDDLHAEPVPDKQRRIVGSTPLIGGQTHDGPPPLVPHEALNNCRIVGVAHDPSLRRRLSGLVSRK
ncbi:hypothetical protein D3C85_1732750 [compost metagenome]